MGSGQMLALVETFGRGTQFHIRVGVVDRQVFVASLSLSEHDSTETGAPLIRASVRVTGSELGSGSFRHSCVSIL